VQGREVDVAQHHGARRQAVEAGQAVDEGALAEPDGPITAVKRPAGRSRSTPSRARTRVEPAPCTLTAPTARAATVVGAVVVEDNVVVMGPTVRTAAAGGDGAPRCLRGGEHPTPPVAGQRSQAAVRGSGGGPHRLR